MSAAYEVLLHPRARRELDKIPKEIFSRIDKAIWELRLHPRPVGVKKLDENLHRIRLGDWRIIYAISDREHHVVILRVVRRSEKTYRNLP